MLCLPNHGPNNKQSSPKEKGVRGDSSFLPKPPHTQPSNPSHLHDLHSVFTRCDRTKWRCLNLDHKFFLEMRQFIFKNTLREVCVRMCVCVYIYLCVCMCMCLPLKLLHFPFSFRRQSFPLPLHLPVSPPPSTDRPPPNTSLYHCYIGRTSMVRPKFSPIQMMAFTSCPARFPVIQTGVFRSALISCDVEWCLSELLSYT